MFGKKNILISNIDSNGIKYFWKNCSPSAIELKNKYFFTNHHNSVCDGNSIKFNKPIRVLVENNLPILTKHNDLSSDDFVFNTSITYNIVMLNSIELYSILIQAFILSSAK